MESSGRTMSVYGKRRTAGERGIVGIRAAVIIALTGLGLVTTTYAETSGSDNVCTTPGCIHSASEVLKKMDRDVEPCDDFYRFACGGFLNNTVIPEDQGEVNSGSLVNDEIQEQLRSRLEEPCRSTEPKSFKNAKSLYKACMDTTAIEAQSAPSLLEDLKSLGGWPVLEGNQWNEETFNWIETIYKFREVGYSHNYLISFSSKPDPKDRTRQVLFLDEGTGPSLREEYQNYMVNVAVILGADRQSAENELSSVFEFMEDIDDMFISDEERHNDTALYNPTTIGELSRSYPSIPWEDYFNRLLPPSVRVNDSEVVIVKVPAYIPKILNLLEKTPKRIQANYLMWRAVADSVDYLNDHIRDQQLVLTGSNGNANKESRWKECVRIASEALSISVGAMYVRKYFHEDAKRHAVEMVNDIRNQFHKNLEAADWMDEETRKSALEKAEAMTNHIAYPDEVLDDQKLEKYYKRLEITYDNYRLGILNITRFSTDKEFCKLRKPFDKNAWEVYGNTAQVNAAYHVDRNSIEIPAGILQGAFFNNDRPRYMNYGGIGGIIGHEITHGFDDRGRLFDKDGNLVDWWAPSTLQRYLEKAQCIVDQYGNFSVEEAGLNLNGVKTEGENIADNGGIREAYLAYSDWTARNGPEQMLPGLPYTPKQMFWISSADIFCEVLRPEQLPRAIHRSVHSLGRFRVLGTLSNIAEFSEDFECPTGSRMNPEKKCTVW